MTPDEVAVSIEALDAIVRWEIMRALTLVAGLTGYLCGEAAQFFLAVWGWQ